MTDNDYEISKLYNIVQENMQKCQSNEMRRLFHGRGGVYESLSFLNIDLFSPAVLITLYEERDRYWKDCLSDKLISLDLIETIAFQSRIKAPWVNEIHRGDLPENHIVEENHLKFSVSLTKSENPGIFPDMRDGRLYLKKISKGKKVLNLFSYTCAFSVAAIEGGASSVLNIDMNSNSLGKGRLNHELNHHNKGSVSYLSHNILKSFGKISKKGPYDLIIIDPPPSQGTSFNLERDYGKILRRSRDFLGGTGEILACLNSHNHDFRWFQNLLIDNLGEHSIIKKMGAGDDFYEKDIDRGIKNNTFSNYLIYLYTFRSFLF